MNMESQGTQKIQWTAPAIEELDLTGTESGTVAASESATTNCFTPS